MTNKLFVFFEVLLKLGREQGDFDKISRFLQKYINNEITVSDVVKHLQKNDPSKELPQTLLLSLKNDIHDLRSQLLCGKLKIDGINPPVGNVNQLNNQTPIMNNDKSVLINNQSNPNTESIQIKSIMPYLTSMPTTNVCKTNSNESNSINNTEKTSIDQLSQSDQSSSSNQNSNIILTNENQELCPITYEESYETVIPEALIENNPNFKSNILNLSTSIINIVNYRNKIAELSNLPINNILTISDEALIYVSEALENFSMSLLEQAVSFCNRRKEFFNGFSTIQMENKLRKQSQIQGLDREELSEMKENIDEISIGKCYKRKAIDDEIILQNHHNNNNNNNQLFDNYTPLKPQNDKIILKDFNYVLDHNVHLKRFKRFK